MGRPVLANVMKTPLLVEHSGLVGNPSSSLTWPLRITERATVTENNPPLIIRDHPRENAVGHARW